MIFTSSVQFTIVEVYRNHVSTSKEIIDFSRVHFANNYLVLSDFNLIVCWADLFCNVALSLFGADLRDLMLQVSHRLPPYYVHEQAAASTLDPVSLSHSSLSADDHLFILSVCSYQTLRRHWSLASQHWDCELSSDERLLRDRLCDL